MQDAEVLLCTHLRLRKRCGCESPRCTERITTMPTRFRRLLVPVPVLRLMKSTAATT